MIVEIIEGLTRDDLTSELSRLRAARVLADNVIDRQRSELRDYAETVGRLRIRNEHLEKQNAALMHEIERLKRPVH